MARIRTIKPEFPQSESVGKLSRDARLTFIQLWTIVDDDGRARAASRMLASLLFPYDDDAPGLVESWLRELQSHGFIERYIVDGSSYLQVVNWRKHQKIDHPSSSKLPAPPTEFAKPREPSRNLAPDLDLGRDQDRDQEKESAARRNAREKRIEPHDDGSDLYRSVLDACRAALGEKHPADGAIGPIVGLVEQGIELKRIVTVLRSERHKPRRKPIYTWALWAEIVVEQLDAAPKVTPIAPEDPTDPVVSLPGGAKWRESSIRQAVQRYQQNRSWPDILGSPPGKPGCHVPKHLLPESTAA